MEYIPFNYYTISLLIGGFTALISGIVVLAHNYRRLENQAWFALTMCTSIWSFAYFYMTIANSYTAALISNTILHYAAIFIPLFYYLLVLIITNTVNKHRLTLILLTLAAFFFTVINSSTLFIESVVPKVGFNFAPVPGPLYILYFLYFVLVVFDGLITTGNEIKKLNDRSVKLRLFYTILFTIFAAVGGGSVFLTTFFPNVPPYLLIMFSIYPAISGYAIMRYQLFDVKMVVTQILTFILWIFILIRTLLSESFREEMVNLALLVITIILGIFLIKSVKKEIKQREHIEKLAEDLEKANENQVALIHFITHQVKGFFTKSRDIFSLLIENEAGELPEPAKKYLHEGFDSDTKGVAMVEDVLSAANIKSGAVTYDLKPIDLGELISGMIKEYKKTAENKGLSFTYNTKNISGGYIINADKEKLVNVFRNLIENSIKYTPKGAMVISLFKKSILDQKGMPIDKVVFSVEDTGVGITPEDKKMLFTQGGRGKDSVKINVDSTGYGLFIAKGIVEAHGGRIWVDSDGPGKGSKFYVEIDAIGK